MQTYIENCKVLYNLTHILNLEHKLRDCLNFPFNDLSSSNIHYRPTSAGRRPSCGISPAAEGSAIPYYAPSIV